MNPALASILFFAIALPGGGSLPRHCLAYPVTIDPRVEFLELGVSESGQVTWKIIGPDMDGTYGSQNGTGGFDAIVPGPELFCPAIGDFFGNTHAVYDVTHNALMWNSNRVTAYGAVPGHKPVPFGSAGNLVEKCAWRNRGSEVVGLSWVGGNWYDPEIGQFISFDPYGHASSPSGYAFCNGNPAGPIWDADGRFGKNGLRAGTGIDLDSSVPFRDQLLAYRQGGQEHVAPFVDTFLNFPLAYLFAADPRLSQIVIDEIGSPLSKRASLYNPNAPSVQFVVDTVQGLQDATMALAGMPRQAMPVNWQARRAGQPKQMTFGFYDEVPQRRPGTGGGAAEGGLRLLTAGRDLPNAGGVIRSFVQESDQVYYRVFSGDRTVGSFLTATPPRSSAWAQEALSLPPGNTAQYIQEVLVPAGTRLQRSRALAVPEWGRFRGGAEQFQLLEHIPGQNFGAGRALP